MNQTIFEVRDVFFRHRLSRDAYSEPVLKGVSLSVEEGEILILIGPSGAGKTTLLRLLNRLDDPEKGQVLFKGSDIRKMRPQELRRQVVLVLQEPFLIEETVRDNLQLPLEAQDQAERMEARTGEALASVGLPQEILNRSICHLSLGEKQRVCIARTLMMSPKVVLLDEPTSALDPENREILAETVKRINRTGGITFVVVTHMHDFAESLGGRLMTLKRGEVLQ